MTLTLIEQASQAFHSKDYTKAKFYYGLAEKLYPEMQKILQMNIELCDFLLKDAGILDVNIDIVVPVYNALEDVQKCLKSLILNQDDFNVRVIVVNDGSDQETTQWLKEYCLTQGDKITLIHHVVNQGYTKAVNAGLRASTAEYVITQNSDTIVTKGWLKGLVRCLLSNNKIGIVGPLSNAASWQTVPKLRDMRTGDFLINDIPQGFTIESFSHLIHQVSLRKYPRVTFVNGFCFMIKRQVIDRIGYMDEDNFPVGYGEENDYCIRAIDAGFELAIVDDVYVYHAKSKSFGHERRQELSRQGTDNLRKKHGNTKYNERVDKIKETFLLDSVREQINFALESQISKASIVVDDTSLESFQTKERSKIQDFEILFILPVSGDGGGVHSIVQESYAMLNFGINVKIATHQVNLEKYHTNYPEFADIKKLVIPYQNVNELVQLAESFDIIISTINNSVALAKKIYEKYPNKIYAYYVQDYEPLFYEEGSERYKTAYDSYQLIPNQLCFAKTQWILNEIKEKHNVTGVKVCASIDHDVYQLDAWEKKTHYVISAMIRPTSARRGALRTMQVLRKLKERYQNEIEIIIFGCEQNDPFLVSEEFQFQYKNLGVLKRAEVAQVLKQSHVFLDLSDYQAFGRTALEAMACGTVAIVPKFGGADEYAVDGINSIVVDPYNQEEVFVRVGEILQDEQKYLHMQLQASLTAANYSVKKAALSELDALIRYAHQQNYKPKIKLKKKTVAIMPVFIDKNNPAGSAYVRLIYPYIKNTSEYYDVLKTPLRTLPEPGTCDTVIMQRDMAHIDMSTFIAWAANWKKHGGKIVYDIDDDLTDIEGVCLRTNRTKESAENLKNRVITFARYADVVTVSMPKLENVFLAYNENVKVVYNMLDNNLWKVGSGRKIEPDFLPKPNDPIRIGYVGTPTHNQDLMVINSAVQRIKKEFGDSVIFEVIGAFKTPKENFIGASISLPKKREYPVFADWLTKRINWDIGLIPLLDDEFNQSKSFLKFSEYSALGLSIICSDVASYRLIAKNEINALSVKNTEDAWFNAMKKLILDKQLRNKLAQASFEELRDNFIIDRNMEVYRDVLV